jgi:hypothetical protein
MSLAQKGFLNLNKIKNKDEKNGLAKNGLASLEREVGRDEETTVKGNCRLNQRNFKRTTTFRTNSKNVENENEREKEFIVV